MSSFDPWPDVEVHVDWGPVAAALAGERGDVVAVVDVLSFSTAVVVIAERGGIALPFTGEELDAGGGRAAVAEAHGALALADARTLTGYSLSPASLLGVGPGDRFVATSFNGAACTVAADAGGSPLVLAVALRNRAAGAAALDAALAAGAAGRATVVCCAERWSSVAPGTDGTRPGVEDLAAAGAVVAAMAPGRARSPEARAAEAVWHGVGPDVGAWLRSTVSGRELVAKGFAADLDVAAQVDATDVVPALDADRAFVGRDAQP
jgi:2-phosphosulfolactate phosphatase